VQAPRTDWPDLGDLGVERDLSFAPVLPTFAVVAVAEYQIALAAIGVESPGLSAQDLDGQRHQRNDMLALVLAFSRCLVRVHDNTICARSKSISLQPKSAISSRLARVRISSRRMTEC
jgi:hypothetical protein